MPYFLLQLILLRWWGMQVTNALAPQHVPFTWTHFVKVTTTYNNYKKLMLTKETTRQSFLKDPTMTLQTCKPVFFFWMCLPSFLRHDANTWHELVIFHPQNRSLKWTPKIELRFAFTWDFVTSFSASIENSSKTKPGFFQGFSS